MLEFREEKIENKLNDDNGQNELVAGQNNSIRASQWLSRSIFAQSCTVKTMLLKCFYIPTRSEEEEKIKINWESSLQALTETEINEIQGIERKELFWNVRGSCSRSSSISFILYFVREWKNEKNKARARLPPAVLFEKNRGGGEEKQKMRRVQRRKSSSSKK